MKNSNANDEAENVNNTDNDVTNNDTKVENCDNNVGKRSNGDVTSRKDNDVPRRGDSDDIIRGDSDVTRRGDSDDIRIDSDVTRIEDSDVKSFNSQNKWYRINCSMAPTKLAYFCETGRRIGFAPNLALFLISIGLNKEESGFIVGLR